MRAELSLFLSLIILVGCGSSYTGRPLTNIPPPGSPTSSVLWAKQIGTTSQLHPGDASLSDYCSAAAKDSQGNYYCAGNTEGYLGEGSGGSQDAFIIKLSSTGQIIWIKQFGATSLANPNFGNAGYDAFTSITVDRADNIIVAGLTAGDWAEPSGGGTDMIFMKLDKNGNLLWSKQFGAVTVVPGNTGGNDVCNQVITDRLDNIYCAGETTGDFAETSGGGSDIVFLKLDPAGNLIWATQLGAFTTGSGNNSSIESCPSLALDSASNVYCTGHAWGAMQEASGGGFTDVIIVKVDSSGALQWIKQFGAVTTAPGGSNSGTDNGRSILITPQDEIVISGITKSSMGETNGGGTDLFVAKLTSAGALIWFKQLGASTRASGGNNAGDETMHNSLGVDTSGNIFLAGYTTGSMAEANGGTSDNVFVKFNSAGALQSVLQLGAVSKIGIGVNTGTDIIYSALIDSSGDIFGVGYTNGSQAETSGGFNDIVAIKVRMK